MDRGIDGLNQQLEANLVGLFGCLRIRITTTPQISSL